MPISRDRFDQLDPDETRTPERDAAAVLEFLRENADTAFRPEEISREVTVQRRSVESALARLADAGRVDHRGSYWRVSDHEQSVAAATDHGTTALAEHEAAGETPAFADWQEHAVDPRDERDDR